MMSRYYGGIPNVTSSFASEEPKKPVPLVKKKKTVRGPGMQPSYNEDAASSPVAQPTMTTQSPFTNQAKGRSPFFNLSAANPNPSGPTAPTQTQLDEDYRNLLARRSQIRARMFTVPSGSPERMAMADEMREIRARGQMLETLRRQPKPEYTPDSPASEAYPDSPGAQIRVPFRPETVRDFTLRNRNRLNSQIVSERERLLNEYNDAAKSGNPLTDADRSKLERAQGMNDLPVPDVVAMARRRAAMNRRLGESKESALAHYDSTFGQERRDEATARSMADEETALMREKIARERRIVADPDSAVSSLDRRRAEADIGLAESQVGLNDAKAKFEIFQIQNAMEELAKDAAKDPEQAAIKNANLLNMMRENSRLLGDEAARIEDKFFYPDASFRNSDIGSVNSISIGYEKLINAIRKYAATDPNTASQMAIALLENMPPNLRSGTAGPRGLNMFASTGLKGAIRRFNSIARQLEQIAGAGQEG